MVATSFKVSSTKQLKKESGQLQLNGDKEAKQLHNSPTFKKEMQQQQHA